VDPDVLLKNGRSAPRNGKIMKAWQKVEGAR
jgi:hypothetical protein